MKTEYYTVKEVADLLEISEYRVKKLIHNGLLRAKRGSRRQFLISDIALFDYAIRVPKYRELLSAKIGPSFIMYKTIYEVAITVHNSKSISRVIRKLKEEKEARET